MVPDLVERLIINLLENALKYCPSGSQVEVILEQRDGAVICSVSDNGPGIPEHLLTNLFAKFTRAKHAPEISGVGLGLRFVKVVMERHHGTVNVRNNPGGGSRFELTFPSTQ